MLPALDTDELIVILTFLQMFWEMMWKSPYTMFLQVQFHKLTNSLELHDMFPHEQDNGKRCYKINFINTIWFGLLPLSPEQYMGPEPANANWRGADKNKKVKKDVPLQFCTCQNTGFQKQNIWAKTFPCCQQELNTIETGKCHLF